MVAKKKVKGANGKYYYYDADAFGVSILAFSGSNLVSVHYSKTYDEVVRFLEESLLDNGCKMCIVKKGKVSLDPSKCIKVIC